MSIKSNIDEQSIHHFYLKIEKRFKKFVRVHNITNFATN